MSNMKLKKGQVIDKNTKKLETHNGQIAKITTKTIIDEIEIDPQTVEKIKRLLKHSENQAVKELENSSDINKVDPDVTEEFLMTRIAELLLEGLQKFDFELVSNKDNQKEEVEIIEKAN